jgi:hypothetical protein
MVNFFIDFSIALLKAQILGLSFLGPDGPNIAGRNSSPDAASHMSED